MNLIKTHLVRGVVITIGMGIAGIFSLQGFPDFSLCTNEYEHRLNYHQKNIPRAGIYNRLHMLKNL